LLRTTKSGIRWAIHVACNEEMRNTLRFSENKLMRETPWDSRQNWEYDIKMHLRAVSDSVWAALSGPRPLSVVGPFEPSGTLQKS
jgi:hypothetical protein